MTQVEVVLAGEDLAGPPLLQHLSFAAMTIPLAVRRAHPVLAVVVSSAGLAAQTLVGPAPVAGGFLALLVLLVSMGWYAGTRRGLLGLAACLAAGLLYDVVGDRLVVADLVVNASLLTAAWVAGRLLRVATDRRVAVEVAAERTSREAVLAERARIAGDLHDSVAHALTLITLQAGSARERLGQPVAAEALETIEHTGREALADMHRFLALLDERAAVESRGIADLPTLTDRVRASGLDVSLDPCRDLEVSPGISSTVYRIVQEALTNVVRHSDARAVTVQLRRDGDNLVTRVCDDGRPVAARTAAGGRGLDGLTERVAAFGGSVIAGDTGSGWQVEARLPLAGGTR